MTATRSTATPASAGTRRSRIDMDFSFGGDPRGIGDRVGDLEAGSSRGGGRDRDLAAHGGRELADDGEPESGTPGVDDGVALPTEEATEDLLSLGSRDTGALVLHGELCASVPGADEHADRGADR